MLLILQIKQGIVELWEGFSKDKIFLNQFVEESYNKQEDEVMAYTSQQLKPYKRNHPTHGPGLVVVLFALKI